MAFLLFNCSGLEKNNLESPIEEEPEKAVLDVHEAIDCIGMLINEKNFDEAKNVFDENMQVIQQTADEGMCDPDHRIRELYKEFRENLLRMREILDRKDLTPDSKRSKALQALMETAKCKRQAAMLKIYEH